MQGQGRGRQQGPGVPRLPCGGGAGGSAADADARNPLHSCSYDCLVATCPRSPTARRRWTVVSFKEQRCY
eukprot:COSAG01_NODE_3530_length_5964_cov_653.329241_2_plen_70_part_00